MFYMITLDPMPGMSIQTAAKEAFVILGNLPAEQQDRLVLKFNGRLLYINDYANPTELIAEYTRE